MSDDIQSLKRRLQDQESRKRARTVFVGKSVWFIANGIKTEGVVETSPKVYGDGRRYIRVCVGKVRWYLVDLLLLTN